MYAVAMNRTGQRNTSGKAPWTLIGGFVQKSRGFHINRVDDELLTDDDSLEHIVRIEAQPSERSTFICS